MRRPRSRLPFYLTLAVVGLLAGLALAAAFSLPRLAAVWPAPGAQGLGARAPIRLAFSRPMDHASVEAALRTSPSVAGSFAWENETLTFTPGQPWPLNQTVTVTLAGGRGRSGLPLLGGRTWTFGVGGQRIAYLLGEVSNLWILVAEEGAQPQAVTAEPAGVYDFDVSPDGALFVYAALRPDGGADLRLVNVDGTGAAGLLACPGQACLSPAFSPDGRRVAYERHSLVAGAVGQATFAAPRVHVFAPATGQDLDPEAAEPQRQTRFPRWGPDGRLSYLDAGREVVVIRDLASGAVTYVPNSSGDMGTWSPDGRYLVFPEIFLPPEPAPNPAAPEPEGADKFFSHLLRVTIATNQTENLSGEGVVEDRSPVYSPSGEWIAFARKGLGPGQWTPGLQLWLMRADGTQARALTAEPLHNHSAFAWSPDGAALVYMRSNASDPAASAEIWTIRADGAGARQLVSGGYLPAWLP